MVFDFSLPPNWKTSYNAVDSAVDKEEEAERSPTYKEFVNLLDTRKEIGKVEGQQELLMRFAKKRLGEPSREDETVVSLVTSREDLYCLLERVLEVTTWDELLTDMDYLGTRFGRK